MNSVTTYAIFENGGKQYRACEGDVLRLEKLACVAGEKLSFDRVLAVGSGSSITLGSPHVAGGVVEVIALKQGLHKKLHIVKMKRRKHYRRQMGHRQSFTEVRVEKIRVG